jgi:hypothetical protein
VITLAILEADASQIAGTPTSIRCDAPSTFDQDVLGYVIFVDGQVVAKIHLPQPTCRRLQRLDTTNTIDASDVLVLEHEATHVALNSQNECLVEATALANEWQLVRLLRLAAWRAKAILAGAAYVDAHMPSPYHAGCPA